MKKLMIAAAAAAMVGGAFAVDSAVYNLKINLKTLTPKTTTCSKSDCTICTPAVSDNGYYYENGTVKIEGLIAGCGVCTLWGEDFKIGALALWDASNKQRIFFDDAWKTAKNMAALTNIMDDVVVSNVFPRIDTTVYGKSSTKVGLDMAMDFYAKDIPAWDDLGVFKYDLRLVGLGTYAWSGNAGYAKSVSGNVAGRIPAYTGFDKTSKYYWDAQIVDNECLGAAKYCYVDDDRVVRKYNVEWTKEAGVPAYGTWTIKYNASAIKKDLNKSLPSYALKDEF